MPISFNKLLEPHGEIGMWAIKEEENWFLDQLNLEKSEQEQLDKIKGHRRLEWLAARLLIHEMSGREKRGLFIKDKYGKPHLENSPFQISISHSRKIAAAIAAPKRVGIDIQQYVPKIERLAHKFLSNKETDSLDKDHKLWHLHVYWGAKEALYKAYGRRQLNFCHNISIDPFTLTFKGGFFKGKILKGRNSWNYHLGYNFFENYTLVYAIEQ